MLNSLLSLPNLFLPSITVFISVNDASISQVAQAKNLGLVLDSSLSKSTPSTYPPPLLPHPPPHPDTLGWEGKDKDNQEVWCGRCCFKRLVKKEMLLKGQVQVMVIAMMWQESWMSHWFSEIYLAYGGRWDQNIFPPKLQADFCNKFCFVLLAMLCCTQNRIHTPGSGNVES